MPKLIQRTELKTFYYTPVHCPFCGVRVMGADPVDETRITACAHTLFTRVRQLRSQVLVFARARFQKCHYNSASCSGAAGFSIPNA